VHAEKFSLTADEEEDTWKNRSKGNSQAFSHPIGERNKTRANPLVRALPKAKLDSGVGGKMHDTESMVGA